MVCHKKFISKVIKTNLSMAVKERERDEMKQNEHRKKINDAIEDSPRHNMCKTFHF